MCFTLVTEQIFFPEYIDYHHLIQKAFLFFVQLSRLLFPPTRAVIVPHFCMLEIFACLFYAVGVNRVDGAGKIDK